MLLSTPPPHPPQQSIDRGCSEAASGSAAASDPSVKGKRRAHRQSQLILEPRNPLQQLQQSHHPNEPVPVPIRNSMEDAIVISDSDPDSQSVPSAVVVRTKPTKSFAASNVPQRTSRTSPSKRTRSPTVSTSAPSKMQKSKDDAAVSRLQPRITSTSWQRSRSHQTVSLTPGQRWSILGSLARELIWMILAQLSFQDIRALLKADCRLRCLVHHKHFALWRKRLAEFLFKERKFDEMVVSKGDAIWRAPTTQPSPTGSGPGPGPDPTATASRDNEVEAAFLRTFAESVEAMKLDRVPISPSDLVSVVLRAFPHVKPSARLRGFVTDLLLGQARAAQAFELVESAIAVELLSLVRLYLAVMRIARAFAAEGRREPSQTAHFLDADCRDALRAFFQPVPQSCTGSGFQLTEEQSRFVERDVLSGQIIKVQAFAGTGKTRSLVAYAKKRPKQKFLYIAFNNHAAVDARYRFSHNVDCKTMHAVCLHQVERASNQKLGNIRPQDVVMLFDRQLPKGMKTSAAAPPAGTDREGDGKLSETAVAAYILRTLNQYMYSDDKDFAVEKHVPKQVTTDTSLPPARILQLAQDLWCAIQRGKTEDGRPVSCPHDAYVKMLQLRQPPRPDPYFARYDVLLLDEAQDLSAAQVSILLRANRHCGILVVGDAHQKIYGFRGGTARAFNDRLYPPTATFQLTRSFRFGDAIARVASKILGLKPALPWQDRPDRPWLSGVVGDGDRVYSLKRNAPGLPSQHEQDPPGHSQLNAAPIPRTGGRQRILKHTQIFRSNKCLVETALILGVSMEESHKLYLKTSQSLTQSSIVDLLRDGFLLYSNKGGRMSKGSILRDFGSWKQLVQRVEAEEAGGDNMLALVVALEKLFEKDDFLERLDTLKDRFSPTEKEASIVLTTCHQSKGLEWDRVVVADDFRPGIGAGQGRPQVRSLWQQDELNLMYVAVTRAKKELIIADSVLQWLVVLDGMCTLRAETLDGRKCPRCGSEGREGVVRVFRVGEHDFVSRSDGGDDDDGDDDGVRADADDEALLYPDQDLDGDEGSSGPAPPYTKAVGCFPCLQAARVELDDDLLHFLELHHRTRAGTGAGAEANANPPRPAASPLGRDSAGSARSPFLTHPHRLANWDRMQTEMVGTVQRWRLLAHHPGLLPSVVPNHPVEADALPRGLLHGARTFGIARPGLI